MDGRNFFGCAVAGSAYWSMHNVHSVPTVYVGSSENLKAVVTKTFEPCAARRQWVNIIVASKRGSRQ
jgi:hypothetical protein